MSDEATPAAPVQNGPQPGGMSKEDVARVTQGFMGKCCPLGLVGLSMPAPAPSALVGPLGQPAQQADREMVACQGPRCMWFRIVKDQNGKVLYGDCVVNLAANALSSAPQVMAEMLAQLGKFRFTPNGG